MNGNGTKRTTKKNDKKNTAELRRKRTTEKWGPERDEKEENGLNYDETGPEHKRREWTKWHEKERKGTKRDEKGRERDEKGRNSGTKGGESPEARRRHRRTSTQTPTPCFS